MKRAFKIGCLTFGGLAVLLLVISLAVAPKVDQPPASVAKSSPPPASTPPQAATAKEWYALKEFKGSGPKETEAFTPTGREWKLGWVMKESAPNAAYFGVSVHDATTDRMVSMAINTNKPGQDETIVRSSGAVYLKVNAANCMWWIVVGDQR